MLRCTSKQLRVGIAAGALLALPCTAVRVDGQIVPVKSTGTLQHVTMAEYQAHLARVKALVQACGSQSAACDAKAVGDDERVGGDATTPQTFQVRWQWLRNSLEQARTGKAEQRSKLMQAAAERLDEMVRDNAQPATDATQFAAARAEANHILAGGEFANVEKLSWLDRLKARFVLWLERIFTGVGSLGELMPWLGRLLEWLLFGGAAVALLLFVRRNLQRQRLAVALNSQVGQLAWSRESNDWAAQAESSARSGDWRDAVHCLYWATIVMLEGRRAWRHNPARTPREYVRLLKPGSAQQGSLRGLTQIFERLWYGLREADAADYERARAHYESLRDKASASGSSAGAA